MLGRWRSKWKRSSSVRLPGILAVILIAMLQITQIPAISPAIQRVGLMIFDSYQRISPRPYEDAAVRVVDIDDETIRRFGQWPWPRTDMARLTQALGEAGAAAIAFDIVYSEPDRTSPRQLARHFVDDPEAARTLAALPDNDEQFAAGLAVTPSVLGFFLTNEPREQQALPKVGLVVFGTPPASAPHYSNAVLPLPGLLEAAAGAGSLSIAPDADSIIRRAPLIAIQDDQILPALSVEALRVAQRTDSVVVKTSDASGENGAPGDVVSLRIGAVEVPTDSAGEMWMHYTRDVPERTVPAWKILSGAIDATRMEQLFAGHIVFVGTSAIGLRDLRATPLNDRELGVMIHAQAAEQIILQKFLYRPDWAIGLERALVLVLGLGLVLFLPGLGAAKGAALGAATVTLMVGGSWYAFTQFHYLLNPTWPVLALTAAYLLGTVLVYYREERQRAYIHHAFDRYLAPELVRRIADDPSRLELGGEEREMTVLFCDVRGFTGLSEKLKPNEIIRFLIALLTPLTDILLAHRATIDKYIGDAILAFWNAPLDDPDQHENAARAALAMVARLAELNAAMPAQRKAPWPGEVRVGIGLSAGLCCVGNMGSRQRLAYSLIGDTVNLASRIESLTKFYGVPIAIGRALYERIPHFATLQLDLVRVVGRDRPEEVHALLGDPAMAADPAFRDFASRHEAMLAAYRAREWDDAEAIGAAQAEDAARLGLDKLYALYAERFAVYRAADPGKDWSGVYAPTEK